MQVNLGGIIHLSTVDWTGHAATVLFLRGCPLRCPHCQNRELQTGVCPARLFLVDGELVIKEIDALKTKRAPSHQITFIDMTERIKESGNREGKPSIAKIDRLVLTGGEPLMQIKAVRSLAQAAAEQGIKVALETCGYYPDRLEDLLEIGLINKVFLDIKSSFEGDAYNKATGTEGAAARVLDSLKICLNRRIPLEIRITVFPEMPSAAEVHEIAKTISDLKMDHPNNRLELVTLQQGRPIENEFMPVSPESLRDIAGSIQDLVDVRVRDEPKIGIDKVINLEGS